jgi:hypothetical protein
VIYNIVLGNHLEDLCLICMPGSMFFILHKHVHLRMYIYMYIFLRHDMIG